MQRRSILELLTSKLIDDGILSGNATIKVKGGGTKTVSWSEKLKYLLARKTETVTEKYPLISNGMVAAFLVAVLTPIFTFIAYAVKPTPTTWWFSLLSIIIAALPVLIALCVWKWAYSKDHKYGWSYMLAIYQDKVEKDVCYETLSEDEPTVYEFKTWMQDISDFIKEKGQRKLVLVFDNMDRLPAEKVKELWSSIHTFFADSGFENVWAVIPFDETHLACAFGDETDEQTKQLTKYFINKTFPIVYRVAPPVITDYRSIFNKLFVEAFGETENEAGKTHYKSCKISSHKNSLSHPAINLFLLIGISLLLFLNVANAIFASTEKFNADIFLLLVLSSWKLTSNCQCRLFSISQCSLLFLSIFCASGSKEDIKHLFSTVVPLFVFLVFSIYPKDRIFFHFFLISAPRKPGSLQQ